MPLEDTISTSNLKQARKQEAISTLKTRVGHFMKETNLAASIGDIPTKLAKTSAVLIVLRYNEQVSTSSDDCWDVLLTLRSNQMRSHRGLVCLPGGKMELGEDATQCALREAKVSLLLYYSCIIITVLNILLLLFYYIIDKL